MTMATPTEAFVLAEMTPSVASQQPTAPTIKRILRTYLGRSRAEQDFELLTAEGHGTYKVLTVEHIDD
jgi:hypothetical protein